MWIDYFTQAYSLIVTFVGGAGCLLRREDFWISGPLYGSSTTGSAIEVLDLNSLRGVFIQLFFGGGTLFP